MECACLKLTVYFNIHCANRLEIIFSPCFLARNLSSGLNVNTHKMKTMIA